jgi:hypothetical protein
LPRFRVAPRVGTRGRGSRRTSREPARFGRASRARPVAGLRRQCAPTSRRESAPVRGGVEPAREATRPRGSRLRASRSCAALVGRSRVSPRPVAGLRPAAGPAAPAPVASRRALHPCCEGVEALASRPGGGGLGCGRAGRTLRWWGARARLVSAGRWAMPLAPSCLAPWHRRQESGRAAGCPTAYVSPSRIAVPSDRRCSGRSRGRRLTD